MILVASDEDATDEDATDEDATDEDATDEQTDEGVLRGPCGPKKNWVVNMGGQ